jgi:hypothetical protein
MVVMAIRHRPLIIPRPKCIMDVKYYITEVFLECDKGILDFDMLSISACHAEMKHVLWSIIHLGLGMSYVLCPVAKTTVFEMDIYHIFSTD